MIPSLTHQLRAVKDPKPKRNGWLAKGVAIATIVVALPTAGLYAGHIIDVWNSCEVNKAQQGQIDTLQKEAQGMREWRSGVTEQLKAIQEGQKEEKVTLHRIEGQLSWEYGHPPTLVTNRP